MTWRHGANRNPQIGDDALDEGRARHRGAPGRAEGRWQAFPPGRSLAGRTPQGVGAGESSSVGRMPPATVHSVVRTGQSSQGLRMQRTMYPSGTSTVRAEALFASVLQRSDRPSPGQVRTAIAAAGRAYGGQGCAELVAQEFGDHPETAAERMRWARAVVSEVFAPLPEPAPGSARRRPGRPAGGLRRRRLARA
jgi:hypothetical protein